MQTIHHFPGGSKERVSRAGDAVREGKATETDFEVINTWRAAHRAVLNTFQGILRNRTRGSNIKVAQRHKRRSTIFDKLQRFPKMKLARMDDVAGCRLIFESINDLYDFRSKLHAAHFRHVRKNEDDKYDYIRSSKSTGYRGVHDVYSYDVNSEHGKPYKGLLIELQYRTTHQHAWATAVEVIGFITESQPKFQQGDRRYEYAMSLASEIIARAFEDRNSCHSEMSNADLIAQFLQSEGDLGLLSMLRGLNAASRNVTEKKNVILIFGSNSDLDDLEVLSYQNATDALRALFQIEKDRPGKDVVLVRAETSEEVRFAFRNYFSDARDFIDFIEKGCEKLSGTTVLKPGENIILSPERGDQNSVAIGRSK